MKRNVMLSLCLILFFSTNLFAVLVPTSGYVSWNGTTGVVSLPVTIDFDYNDNPRIKQGAYFKLYIAQDIVYKVEVYYAAWLSNGSPSSFDILYVGGGKTTIHIPDYSTSSPANGGKGQPIMVDEE